MNRKVSVAPTTCNSKVNRNKFHRKSHSVTQEATIPLSYADAAKNIKKVTGRREFGSANRVDLVHTAADAGFRVEINRFHWPHEKVYSFSKAEKPQVINKKFRLVPNPNNLDSRNPQLIRRGKERTKDTKKKDTKLKRTILEARSRKTKCLNTAEIFEKESEASKDNLTLAESSSNCRNPNQQAEHSRKKVKYREYCDMYVTKNVNMLTEKLLSDLMRFQERVRKTQPAKAKAKRRLVIGLKETTQCLQVNKIKCVIIPPDIEPCPLQGGLDDRLAIIRDLCTDKQVPIIYALGVHKIPKALGLPSRRHKTSAVGIYSYEGAFELFKQLLEEARKERERWRQVHETPLSNVQNTYPMESTELSTSEGQQPCSDLSADAKPFIPRMFQQVTTVG
ncbi:hypothetical protein GpartN1_g2061.t1 [Galdieria partita]|uniref:Ribosomal protein eL8/eL30/eS12/Gadd45 domain-containing protein n=1 Tax=Galdieria partita TaxID=83374 RepID=A0A9C7UP88_9RHOD|nr:hypothetical protein GpartN1_g2061.t1 [Galdieria partita]